MKNDLKDFRSKSSITQIQFSEDMKRETLQKVVKKEKVKPKDTFMFKKVLSFATLSVLIIMIALFGYQSLNSQKGADQEKPQQIPDEQNEKDNEERKVQENKPLTNKRAQQILTQFYQDITPDLNENNIETRYESKSEAVEKVQKTTSGEVARKLVDGFYQEKDGVLKPKTFHGIKKFNLEKMALEKVNENKYVIEQLRSNELNGTYVIQAAFEQSEQGWIITKYEIEYQENHK
ncbi:hypothetical protein [Pseudalkalibacillus berkeleyi]|uniref:Uncharacterized protein n=1 Tax=Pseudalkalibacillus berkeleyi TaxID=1069813 RepID=A0ABS9GXA9_9BACL|nr:hypothetical protein [Pseudalkalibacillus berkeleyi]MCF6137412.1 hypothetical protein [Pseudalkalibacillus berkeleyi]